MDNQKAVDLAFAVLANTVTGNTEQAVDALVELGTNTDDREMYAACCSWAEAGRVALADLYADEKPDPASGDLWIVEQIEPGVFDREPEKAFGIRFLIAWSNDDYDTTVALYKAAQHAGGDQFVDSVGALVSHVAGIIRLAIETREQT